MIRPVPGVLAAALFALGSTSALAAQDPTSAAPAQGAAMSAAPGQAAPKSNEDEVVCKQEKVTGSRLGGHKTCMTRLEWAKQERSAKDATAHGQVFTGGSRYH